jgi:hypothetical protein
MRFSLGFKRLALVAIPWLLYWTWTAGDAHEKYSSSKSQADRLMATAEREANGDFKLELYLLDRTNVKFENELATDYLNDRNEILLIGFGAPAIIACMIILTLYIYRGFRPKMV